MVSDTAAGTPWGGFPLNDLVVQQGRILGVHTQLSRDAAIRERIVSTFGVLALNDYYSTFDPDTRAFAVGTTIDTIYGRQFSLTINQSPGATQPTINLAVAPAPRMPLGLPPPPLLRRLPAR